MRQIRVLLITRSSEGGVATIATQLARGLDRQKFKPFICQVKNGGAYSGRIQFHTDFKTFGSRETPEDAPEKKPTTLTPGKNIHGWVEGCLGKTTGALYILLRSTFFFFKRQIPETLRFLRLIKKYKIDLIHTHSDLNYNKPEIIAAKISGVPSISHLHAYTKLNAFDRIFNHLVDFFVYISNDVERYHQTKGKLPNKGLVIYNGIELNRFSFIRRNSIADLNKRDITRTRLIGIVGRIDWWKGYEYFLNALPSIHNRFPDIRALIVGEVARNDNYDRNCRYLESLESLVASKGLENIVTFTGHRDDIPEIMSNLEILVHASSIPEPFGLVIIEGMASGKPVIATAAGGVLEIIHDNVDGILVPCRDSQAISGAIIDLLTDTEKARKIGAQGKRTVTDRFSSEKQIFHIEQLYQRAVRKR